MRGNQGTGCISLISRGPKNDGGSNVSLMVNLTREKERVWGAKVMREGSSELSSVAD